MNKIILTISLGLVTTALLVNSVFALPMTNRTNSVGVDVSWPNCGEKFPSNKPFGIVGVTGGLGLHPNVCVGEEAAYFRSNLSLYANTEYPGQAYAIKYAGWPKDCDTSSNKRLCLAYNDGYNQGRYVVDYSLSQGVVSNQWWLDVETVNSWTNSAKANRQSLIGEAAAIKMSLKPSFVGFYSYPREWNIITNHWHNGQLAWLATDTNYKSVAIEACSGPSFTRGKIMLTQYVKKLDQDYSC